MNLPRAHAALLLALLAAGCGTARRGEPIVGQKQIPNPEIALGQRVFDRNCSQCHPGGERGVGVALNDKPLPKWYIKLQVRTGLGAMPSFSGKQINGTELDAVADYLAWLRREKP
jgi:mono/diheme cytochrome c family protein